MAPVPTSASPLLPDSLLDPLDLKTLKLNNNHDENSRNGMNDIQLDVKEDYSGNYKFASIHEAQVSRAMIKR